ncbi:hypothetical protein, partial [uncultured Duncaniella sp.]
MKNHHTLLYNLICNYLCTRQSKWSYMYCYNHFHKTRNNRWSNHHCNLRYNRYYNRYHMSRSIRWNSHRCNLMNMMMSTPSIQKMLRNHS